MGKKRKEKASTKVRGPGLCSRSLSGWGQRWDLNKKPIWVTVFKSRLPTPSQVMGGMRELGPVVVCRYEWAGWNVKSLLLGVMRPGTPLHSPPAVSSSPTPPDQCSSQCLASSWVSFIHLCHIFCCCDLLDPHDLFEVSLRVASKATWNVTGELESHACPYP